MPISVRHEEVRGVSQRSNVTWPSPTRTPVWTPVRSTAVALGLAIAVVFAALLAPRAAQAAVAAQGGLAPLHIGSKRFAESQILGEVLAQRIRTVQACEHVAGIGNTAIVLAALRAGAIDAYPEYLGTIELEVLHHARAGASLAELDRELAAQGLGVALPLGFENRYALGMRADGLQRTSELAAHPGLRGGLTHEFLGRADGWPGLAARYGLKNPVSGLDHGLAFEALARGDVDFIDVYSTDAKIARYGLRILADDLQHFPRYDAVILYRRSLPLEHPAAWQAIAALAGRISETRMIALNALVEGGSDPATVARDFLRADMGADTGADTGADQGADKAADGELALADPKRPDFLQRLFAPDLGRLTARHLSLVLGAVALAILAGVPLGVLAARSRRAGTWVLAAVGMLQTLPALALLAALIPLVGQIGQTPTRIALTLFALLPIVRNTATALGQVPPALSEAATALGARALARLWWIELPLAMPVVLAGVRTATVISVGTATIGAFIGAGGYGERITMGLALNDGALLLAGAVPAALMALAFEGGFAWLARKLDPLRVRASALD
jgi:osmoprotectant transport system permease protein